MLFKVFKPDKSLFFFNRLRATEWKMELIYGTVPMYFILSHSVVRIQTPGFLKKGIKKSSVADPDPGSGAF